MLHLLHCKQCTLAASAGALKNYTLNRTQTCPLEKARFGRTSERVYLIFSV